MADNANGLTAADAQAFKRACRCFGIGRDLYEVHGSWVVLDQNLQPKQIPALCGLRDSGELAEWEPGLRESTGMQREPGEWIQ